MAGLIYQLPWQLSLRKSYPIKFFDQFRTSLAVFPHLMVYRSSSLRIELDVRNIYMVTNETSINQQRLEHKLTEERDQDRRAQDHFCAQVLAQLEDLQLHRRETQHQMTDIQEKPEPLVDNIFKTLQTNEHGSGNSIAQVQELSTVPEHSSVGSDFVSNQVGQWSSIGIRADLRNISECSRICRCSCHIRRRLQTPRLLDRFLGTLFIGYSGLPIPSQKCDQVSCSGRNNSSTSFVYRFPRWFIMSRMVQLKAKVTAMYGPEVSLRFNRVVDGKALVFHYATTGNISKMRQLFEQGRASPSDVRFDSGWTAFHVSILEGVDLVSDIELLLSTWVE